MKRVSFEVAKAIKILGFHEVTDHFYSDGYDDEDNPKHEFVLCTASISTFVQDWNDTNKHPEYDKTHIDYWRNVWSAPTYFEVWSWLWREKKIAIPANYFGHENNYWESCVPIGNDKLEFFSNMKDPEEAIIAAINYLVDNNLLK